MARLLKGKPVADALVEKLRPTIAACKERGVTPKLALVRVGAREDDLSYERSALKRFDALGLAVERFVLGADCSQEELMRTIDAINRNDAIHGCLVFRPLPKHLDEEAACAALLPEKDVDGITQGSLFGVFANRAIGFPPCTAAACIEVLKHYGYDLEGANVTVVGRSLVVGRPVALMLQAENATVTMCHTRTKNLAAVCAAADIVVVAAGHAGVLGANAARAGQVVVDVGINWDAEAQKLCGDVRFQEVEPLVSAITPVPGGVGSVTTALLAKHVVQAACKAAGGVTTA